MKRVGKAWAVAVLVAVAAVWPSAGQAQAPEGEGLVVGVFLPVSVADGQQRLQIAEKLAARLAELTGSPVTGRSFGRFQDFSDALTSGAVGLGVIDGWVAGQLPASTEVVAVGVAPADRTRMHLVAKASKTVPQLKGGSVAIVRGAPGLEAKVATNVLFSGDLQANKHFKLVSVPNAESALEALEAGAAEAAILPASAAQGLTLLYAAPNLPVALAVRGKKALAPSVRDALLKVAQAPVDRFVPARGDELSDLRTLTQRGPPPRAPLMAESRTERFDPGLLDFSGVEAEFPALSPLLMAPEESPDD